MKLVSTNPAKNYKIIGEVIVSTEQEIREKVAQAKNAKDLWKKLGVEKRIKILRPLFDEFQKRKKEIALLITREIGKPITEAIGDLNWDQGYFQDFLDNGGKYLQDEITHQASGAMHTIMFEPIGIAAVIVPWNYPFGNFLWGVVPNLIAGNPVVFKHSEECPLTGKLIEDMMSHLSLPSGVFSEVYGDGKMGEYLVQQDIDLIWFTGSTAVGKKLYDIAGKKFIKSIMELGGSNPAIVFEDTELDSIVDQIFIGRFMNCGQVCDALKRLIVHESLIDSLVNKLRKKLNILKVGDPENEKTQIGSLVAKRQLDLLESQVADALDKGAKIEIGGEKPINLKGAYYLPTILTRIQRNMRVWKEEVFGPVLPVISFKTEDEAVMLANDTQYGLGAQIYCKDTEKADRVASRIEAGNVEINGGNHWFPCNPFGGYKGSGIGREHGKYGFQELCQIKVVSEKI